MTKYDKLEVLGNCVFLGIKLEKTTRKTKKCDVGWIIKGFMEYPISLIINHHKGWFVCDGKPISTEFIKNNLKYFQVHDDVYLRLNDLIDDVYSSS